MRLYDIVSGILLILSTTKFALAAPVLVQERRQACVDVVHIPTDVITVLGKRGVAEDLENVVEEYFKTSEKPVESSDAHASSSSAQPGHDHGSTSAVQAPVPNPASSTADPGLLMEPSNPSSIAPSAKGVWGGVSDDSGRWSHSYEGEYELHDVPLDTGSDYGLTGLHEPLPMLPNPNPRPLGDSAFSWNDWRSLLDRPPPRPASQNEFGQAQVEHVQQPNPGPSADSDFNWDSAYWKNLEDLPPLTNSRLNTKLDSDRNLMAANQRPTNPRLTTILDSDRNLMAAYQRPPYPPYPTEFDNNHDVNPHTHDGETSTEVDSYSYDASESAAHPPSPADSENEAVSPSPLNLGPPEKPENEVVPGPPPSPDPEFHLDHQSSSPGFRLEELQSAIYAVKGKTKESRRVSGTARDVGNAAQRELQLAERSLDPTYNNGEESWKFLNNL